MGDWVYVLTPKGRQERASGQPHVPPQMRMLLGLIDGRRTREQILSACGRSTMSAGGLSWLATSGYVARAPLNGTLSTLGPLSRLGATTVSMHGPIMGDAPHGSADAPPSVHHDTALAPPAEIPSPPKRPSQVPVHWKLSAHMVETIRRHLGEAGYPHRRQVERADSIADLLPHLNPLIDALLLAAGPQAAGEFADEAAAILQPQR